MESDFVEAPSQMLEEWMRSPQVLASFARHYKTGEPIPAELVERMNRASAFGRANWVSDQNSYTAISYDIYKTKPENVDPDAVVENDEKKYSPFALLPGTHMYAAFGHLAGYSSAYYTYLWDKVIAEDFFSQFDHSNLLACATGTRFSNPAAPCRRMTWYEIFSAASRRWTRYKSGWARSSNPRMLRKESK